MKLLAIVRARECPGTVLEKEHLLQDQIDWLCHPSARCITSEAAECVKAMGVKPFNSISFLQTRASWIVVFRDREARLPMIFPF